MKRVSSLGAPLVFASLLAGCAAQPEQRVVAQAATPKAMSPAEREFIFTSARLKAAQQYVQAKQSLYTDPVDCSPTADRCRTVKIYITEPQDSSGIYCVGLIPEVVRFGPAAQGNSEKTIVWEILPPANPVEVGSKYEFYDESVHISKAPGIAILNDVNPAQLKNGKLGDGSGGNPDLHFYTMKNDHKKTLDAYYLPIIVKTVPASQTKPMQVALCGTPDPRITND